MTTQRVHMEKMFARFFIAFGALFWFLLSFHADSSLAKETQGVPWAKTFTILYIIGIFILTYYNLNWASHILLVSAAITAIFGIFMHWELGVWSIIAVFFMFPSVMAALLLTLANLGEEE